MPMAIQPERIDIPSAPVRVYMELTRRCNLTCRHSFVGANPCGSDGMATESWIRLFTDLRKCRVIDLRFTGGEVTTRADWFELLCAAKDMEFAVSLNTNAVFEDQAETIQRLASLDLDQVTVSLDGLERCHDSIRGGGAFEKSLSSLAKMRSKGVKTRVNCVLNKYNVHDVPGILKLVSPYVEEINFFYMRPVGRAKQIASWMLDFDSYLVSARETLELQSTYPDVRIMHREEAIQHRSLRSQLEAGSPPALLPSCITTMNISCDGRYWPHGYNTYQHQGLSFGGYPEISLSDAWMNGPKIEIFRRWQGLLLERCYRCHLFGSECPGANIEMEIAAQLNTIASNPYCASTEAAPNCPLVMFGGS